MLLNSIKPDILKELHRFHLTLDHLYVLLCYKVEACHLAVFFPDIETQLERKGFSSSSQGSRVLTEKGRLLIEELSNPNFTYIEKSDLKTKFKKIKNTLDERFFEWWKKYPTGDEWEQNGKKFSGTRSFKVKQEDCQVKYLQVINSIPHSDMILAIDYELHLKKKQSLNTGINKLCFMQNTLTYLNQASYLGYIEMAKKANWKKEDIVDQSFANNTMSI